jgi:hypothetical protein
MTRVSQCPISVHAEHSIFYHLLASGFFSAEILPKFLGAFLISFLHTTCSAHRIILNLITLIIFGEQYKLGDCLFRVLFRFPFPCVSLTSKYSQRTLILCSSLSLRDKFHVM